MTVEEVLKCDIEFVEVNRRLISAETREELIEFTLWLKTTNVCLIQAYKFRLNYERSYKILENLIKRRIPSNYKLFELKDTVVLTRIYRQDTEIEKRIPKCVPLQLIELRLPEDSIHNTMQKLLDRGACILDRDGESHTLTNLVFNRDNLNISCRYYKDDYGFTTASIWKNYGHNFRVECHEELEDIPNIEDIEYNEETKTYTATVNFEDSEMLPYELYIDGVRMNKMLLLGVLSPEYYMRRFSIVFSLQVMKNVLDSFASKIFTYDGGGIVKRESSNRSYNQQSKVLRIEPIYVIPKIKDLSEGLKGTDELSIVSWLRWINKRYGQEVFNLAKQVLSSIDLTSKNNIALQVKLQQEELSERFAMEGLKSNAMKTTCSTNSIFMAIYKRKENLYASSIFDSILRIESLS